MNPLSLQSSAVLSQSSLDVCLPSASTGSKICCAELVQVREKDAKHQQKKLDSYFKPPAPGSARDFEVSPQIIAQNVFIQNLYIQILNNRARIECILCQFMHL